MYLSERYKVVTRRQEMTDVTQTRISCSRATRDLVKEQKRGGESYDELLRKMAEQYEPEIGA